MATGATIGMWGGPIPAFMFSAMGGIFGAIYYAATEGDECSHDHHNHRHN